MQGSAYSAVGVKILRDQFFRTPRFNAAVISTPTAAPNAIHFPMLCDAAPIAAPIAMPRVIPMLITIAGLPVKPLLAHFVSPRLPHFAQCRCLLFVEDFRKLCEMELCGFHPDAMMGACCVRKVTKSPSARYFPASGRKWQNLAWPSP